MRKLLRHTGRLFLREAKMVAHDHSLLLTLLIAPLLYAFFYGSIYSYKVEEKVLLAVADDDKSELSRTFLQQVANMQIAAVTGAVDLRDAQEKLASRHGTRKPMLLKIAPDLAEGEMDGIAQVLLTAKIDGLICTNTTIDRSAVAGARHAEEAGGLSGKPLFDKATSILRGMAQRLGGKIPLIGVGGILSGADAAAKIAAGASLVQFYSGMVYRGPALIGECVEAIRKQAAR